MATTPMERAKKAYAEARKKPGTNGHTPKTKQGRNPPPDEYPEGQRGEAWEGGARAATAADRDGSTEELWEPILLLSEGAVAPPFPLDVFPAPLANLCTEAAAAFPCPVDFVAVPLLTLAGAAIGMSRALMIKRNWIEKANLFTTFIGSPASCKSPPLALLMAPFYERQDKLNLENDAALMAWKSDPDREKKQRPGVKAAYAKNVTTEGLAKLLLANPRGLVRAEDELSALFASLNAYHVGGKGGDTEFYLEAHSSVPILVHRAGEDTKPIYVRHPFLAITGPTTPKKLSEIFRFGEESSGFMERILAACPARVPMKGEDWQEVSDEAIYAWEQALTLLFDLEPYMGAHGLAPTIVRLTSTGRKAWERFTNTLAEELNAEDFPGALEGFYGKHKGQCARIALILSYLRPACERREGENVDGRAVDDAAKVIFYFQGHLRKLLTLSGRDTDRERCERVLKWVKEGKKNSFTKSDLYTNVKSDGLFPGLQEIDRVMTKLCRHNYFREQHQDAERWRGRRPAALYEVNPSIHIP